MGKIDWVNGDKFDVFLYGNFPILMLIKLSIFSNKSTVCRYNKEVGHQITDSDDFLAPFSHKD